MKATILTEDTLLDKIDEVKKRLGIEVNNSSTIHAKSNLLEVLINNEKSRVAF